VAAGRDVIGLGGRRTRFPDAGRNIKQAQAFRAIERNETRYTAVEGIPELRRAISEKSNARTGLDYKPPQTPGPRPAARRSCSTPSWRRLNSGGRSDHPGAPLLGQLSRYRPAVRRERAVIVETREAEGLSHDGGRRCQGHHAQTKWLMMNAPSKSEPARLTARRTSRR